MNTGLQKVHVKILSIGFVVHNFECVYLDQLDNMILSCLKRFCHFLENADDKIVLL